MLDSNDTFIEQALKFIRQPNKTKPLQTIPNQNHLQLNFLPKKSLNL